MVPLNRDDIEMSSASADEQRSCDWTALGNRATPSYPDSQTLSTKPTSMEGGVRIKHEVTFLCKIAGRGTTACLGLACPRSGRAGASLFGYAGQFGAESSSLSC